MYTLDFSVSLTITEEYLVIYKHAALANMFSSHLMHQVTTNRRRIVTVSASRTALRPLLPPSVHQSVSKGLLAHLRVIGRHHLVVSLHKTGRNAGRGGAGGEFHYLQRRDYFKLDGFTIGEGGTRGFSLRDKGPRHLYFLHQQELYLTCYNERLEKERVKNQNTKQKVDGRGSSIRKEAIGRGGRGGVN